MSRPYESEPWHFGFNYGKVNEQPFSVGSQRRLKAKGLRKNNFTIFKAPMHCDWLKETIHPSWLRCESLKSLDSPVKD
jgi:hypothetical protein